jgi:hypothetical protein
MESEQARAIVGLLHDAGVCAYVDGELGVVNAWVNGHPGCHIEIGDAGVERWRGVFCAQLPLGGAFSRHDAAECFAWLAAPHE